MRPNYGRNGNGDALGATEGIIRYSAPLGIREGP
jgi:hypothetical protein